MRVLSSTEDRTLFLLGGWGSWTKKEEEEHETAEGVVFDRGGDAENQHKSQL